MNSKPISNGPPRNIVVATDLSARCDRALDRAAALAATWGARLFAVHALERTDDFYTRELERRLPSWRRSRDARQIAEEQLRREVLDAGGNVTAIVEPGEPVDVILNAVEAHDCGLVVTGIARDETLGRFGLGATVERLVARSRVPVLVVARRPRAAYRHVTVAVEFSDVSRHALRAAMALFPGQRLDVLHTFEVPWAGITGDRSAYEQRFRQTTALECAEFVEREGLGADRRTLVVEQGDAHRVLQQYVADHDVDLVVIGARGRGALLDAIVGSTTKEILTSVRCDTLVVRGGASG